jgi:hypothetical protein
VLAVYGRRRSRRVIELEQTMHPRRGVSGRAVSDAIGSIGASASWKTYCQLALIYWRTAARPSDLDARAALKNGVTQSEVRIKLRALAVKPAGQGDRAARVVRGDDPDALVALATRGELEGGCPTPRRRSDI